MLHYNIRLILTDAVYRLKPQFPMKKRSSLYKVSLFIIVILPIEIVDHANVLHRKRLERA
jgi:hypothetical protein